jgi:multicomponent Na+:H+ antiporter subunit F
MNEIAFLIFISGIILAIFLAFIRLLKGPSAPDRAVALDALTTITTALMVLLALYMKRSIFLDVALTYSVIGFIGVLSLAKFFEGGK